jgi:hypothetical protein
LVLSLADIATFIPIASETTPVLKGLSLFVINLALDAKNQ